jgi:hypothetical protein
MATFQYGNKKIDYVIYHKNNKSDITVAVDWTNGVSVITPENIDQAILESVLQKKPLGS